MTESVIQNRLLRALPGADLIRLRPHLERIEITAGRTIQSNSETSAIFLDSGLLSCFTGDTSREQIEIAMIGREGMSGLTSFLGPDKDQFNPVVQRGGGGHRISLGDLRTASREIPSVLDVLHRFSYAFMVQIAETGRANARQTVEARLARWLLMAHDRIDGNEIELTHEALSTILGVRRPGITVAIHVLEGERMIRARRGAVEIVDRAKLIRASNGSYGQAERAYADVLGPETTPQTALA